jgi:hypothetical protein
MSGQKYHHMSACGHIWDRATMRRFLLLGAASNRAKDAKASFTLKR